MEINQPPLEKGKKKKKEEPQSPNEWVYAPQLGNPKNAWRA
jgi:hypothetical protein